MPNNNNNYDNCNVSCQYVGVANKSSAIDIDEGEGGKKKGRQTQSTARQLRPKQLRVKVTH